MKKIYLSLFLLGMVSITQAQMAPCQSAYDNMFNNTYAGTSYIPGPMMVPLNTDINGVISAGADVDYYQFYITSGGTIRLRLANLPANYQLRLVNSIGNTILTSANSGLKNEVINYTASSSTYYFALVYPANNRTFNATSCYKLRVETITATRLSEDEPVEALPVLAYPNPVNDQVTLKLPVMEEPLRVVILNVQGKTVIERTTDQEETTFDFSQLPAGLYLVEVNGSQGLVGREKLIKN